MIRTFTGRISKLAVAGIILAGLGVLFTILAAATDLPRWVQVLSGALSAGIGATVLGLRQLTDEPMARRAKGKAVDPGRLGKRVAGGLLVLLLLQGCGAVLPANPNQSEGAQCIPWRSFVAKVLEVGLDLATQWVKQSGQCYEPPALPAQPGDVR